jgi:hypothetical protein
MLLQHNNNDFYDIIGFGQALSMAYMFVWSGILIPPLSTDDHAMSDTQVFGLQLMVTLLCTILLVPMHTLTAYLMSIQRALHHFHPQSGIHILLPT